MSFLTGAPYKPNPAKEQSLEISLQGPDAQPCKHRNREEEISQQNIQQIIDAHSLSTWQVETGS